MRGFATDLSEGSLDWGKGSGEKGLGVMFRCGREGLAYMISSYPYRGSVWSLF